MNDVPESIDFSQIFHGMIGKDFIIAFNGNFNLVNTYLIQLLGEMIYRVKSNEIKELRLSNGVVEYTLQDTEPKSWQAIDITAWGNISGNIADQTDLKEVLDTKATVVALNTLEALVNVINTNLSSVTSAVSAANVQINNNTNDITSILSTLTKKVNSTTIKEIRINSDTFQWSPDGINWYQQEVVEDISWGHIVGDILQQTDLQSALGSLSNAISTLNTDVAALQTSLSNLSSTVAAHTSDIADIQHDIEDIEAVIADIPIIQSDLATKASQADLDAHTLDSNNPHNVTKAQVGLSNVDNTSDANKPLSTPQKTYVDEQIAAISGQADLTTIVRNRNRLENIAIANTYEYFDFAGMFDNMLVFVNDYIEYDNTEMAHVQLSGIGSTVSAAYLEVSNYLDANNKLVFKIENKSSTYKVTLKRISLRIVNNDYSTFTEYDDTVTALNTNEYYELTSTLESSKAVSVRESILIISYIAEEVE